VNANRIAQRYVPAGSVKVADKLSDAVAYLATSKQGVRYAIAYCGNRVKPDWHFRFPTDAARERRVLQHFEQRRERLARQKPKPAARVSYVGQILRTCWGYDQTNVEFYQVTALIGDTMVEVREIAQARKETGWERHDCYPMHDEFIDKPLRRKVSRYDGASVRICSVATASPWSGEIAKATSYA
jgi:hypothetical protein